MTTEDFVIDTNPALQALVNSIADTYREAGRVLGVSHTHIWHALNGTRKPITVNLLVKYAQRANIHRDGAKRVVACSGVNSSIRNSK